ncbi:hypothetical protein ABLB69_12855 [Xenorhabdus khoisanae]|uniref:hypothetical protein n=1 Tax=Xenorhabdus khoisanae TaxID=880157 RepID=UPI0032B70D37
MNRSSPPAKSQPRYRQVLLFQSKNAVSDSLRGEVGVSLSGFGCSLAAASLSAVNRQKVTPLSSVDSQQKSCSVEMPAGTAKRRKVQCQTVVMG